MKQLKILFFTIIVITLCTGCSIEYNITINEDTIDENILVDDYITSTRTKDDILNHYNMWYPVFVNFVTKGESIELEDFSTKANGVEYYEKNINETSYGYNYTYKYTYDVDDYYDSYALATTYIEPNVHKTSTGIVLKSSKENMLCDYDYFDKLTINIKIDPNVYKLNYTNATSIDNNTYTWIVDRSNCQNSQIILTLDNVKVTDNIIINDKVNKDNNSKKEKDYSIYIFFGILIILILIGYFIIKSYQEKINKENEDD